MLGMGLERGVAILGKLRKAGAIFFEGETPTVSAQGLGSRELEDTGAIRRRKPRVPGEGESEGVGNDARRAYAELSLDLDTPTAEEVAAMAETVALDDEAKRRILAVTRLYSTANYFEILEVNFAPSKRELKRSYFRLSKEFHPDRYYGQDLGSFAEWLARIFDLATQAFDTLSDPRLREAYSRRLRGEPEAPEGLMQTKEEHAADLFSRACDSEIHGDIKEALALFAAVLRLDGQHRYYRRAAACALRARELSLAEDYAKKAAELRPTDPSYARALSEVYREAGKLKEAQQTLCAALEIHSDNDKLMGEIRADLEAIRRALSEGV
jgi:curved DNA-binding protein CbpA